MKAIEDIKTAIRIKLLQGFLFREETRYWETLVIHQNSFRDYFAQLGLHLFLDDGDGYAYLRSQSADGHHDSSVSREDSDDSTAEAEGRKTVPSLIRKQPLGFDVTLLLVLLREALMQFDQGVSDDFRLILERKELYDMVKTFMGERYDEAKYQRKLDAMINKVLELGLIRYIGQSKDRFEVLRVVRAVIDAENLFHIKEGISRHLEREQ